MLEQVHEHIVSELQQNARTDTIFVVTAIVFNLLVLGINSAIAAEASGHGSRTTEDTILAVMIVMSLLVNGIAVIALNQGKRTREKLLQGVLAMYEDNDVAKYYDPSLTAGYGKRYSLFTAVVVCLAATGIIIPLIVRFV